MRNTNFKTYLAALLLAVSSNTAAVQAAPATGQAASVKVPQIKVDPKLIARVTKLGATKPGFINNLAAARMVAITCGQAAQCKSGPMKKFLKGLTGPKHTELLSEDPTLDFGIQPVAYTPGIISPLVVEELGPATCRFVREPELSYAEEELRVDSGVAIIEANRPMTVRLAEGHLLLKAGAVVKVCAGNGVYRVINLVDDKRDSVQLHVCRRHLSLAPGQEVRYSIDKSLAAEKGHDGCGRRAERDQSCCTYAIKVNEVSIAGLLKHDPVGRQIYHSENSNDKQLTARILKAAVALAFWTQAKTPYTW